MLRVCVVGIALGVCGPPSIFPPPSHPPLTPPPLTHLVDRLAFGSSNGSPLWRQLPIVQVGGEATDDFHLCGVIALGVVVFKSGWL